MAGRTAILGVLAVLVSLAAAAAGSAVSDVPTSAVARVGEELVTRVSFDHWFEVVSAGYGSPARARDYRPPLFRGCVAKARKATRPARPRPRVGQLRTSCRALYERRRDEALGFLIIERWLAGEAAERGVAPTADEHEAAFQRWKLDEYPRESEYRRFLHENRKTEADARLTFGVTLLEERLTQVATAAVAPVTELDVAAYYDRHHEQFTRPELRDFRLLRTRTRAAAAAARRALERGQTWRQVGRRLGIDWVSVAGGRKQRGIARGTLGDTLDPVIFGAPLNRLRGPVETSFGYLVYKVLKIAPPKRQTLAQASEAIARQLAGDRSQLARDAFFEAMQVKWKARTSCRRGFVSYLCAGGPDKPPHSGPT